MATGDPTESNWNIHPHPGGYRRRRDKIELTPYLIFGGTCNDAFDLYAEALNGVITLTVPWDDGSGRVRHCRLEASGQVLHGMDGPDGFSVMPNGAISVFFDTKAEARKSFAMLARRGKVLVSISDVPVAARFGVCDDPFGVRWMVTTIEFG